MPYKVAARDGIRNGATGEFWRYDAGIAPTSFTSELWAALLAEGAVVEVENQKPPPRSTTRKPTRRKRASKED